MGVDLGARPRSVRGRGGDPGGLGAPAAVDGAPARRPAADAAPPGVRRRSRRAPARPGAVRVPDGGDHVRADAVGRGLRVRRDRAHRRVVPGAVLALEPRRQPGDGAADAPLRRPRDPARRRADDLARGRVLRAGPRRVVAGVRDDGDHRPRVRLHVRRDPRRDRAGGPALGDRQRARPLPGDPLDRLLRRQRADRLDPRRARERRDRPAGRGRVRPRALARRGGVRAGGLRVRDAARRA